MAIGARRMQARKRLYAWMAVLNDLEGAARLLDWDRETAMPPKGAEARGRQVATLRALRHREVLRAEVGDDLAVLADDPDLGGDEGAILALARRERARAERVSEALVRELSGATSASVGIWLDARPRSDFASFAPALQRVVDLTRETGAAIGFGDEPYDSLLDRFEPAARVADLAHLFAGLRTTLPELAARSPGPGRESPFASRAWPEDAQLAVARDVAAMVGFDMESGVISQSAHPFTDSPHRGDVRFTTRLLPEDPTANVLVVLHEAGHALYAQGHPAEHEGTLLYWSPSCGADESQSRFFENHLGRRLSFWRLLHPILGRRFGAAIDGLTPADFQRAITRVEPGWCRVEADEVTYDLHIVLRFELELALIRGELRVADLSEAWTLRMQELLGVTPADDAEGCMQDIHWALGLIGYFPTYTLGNVYAAQLARALEREIGPLDEIIDGGELTPILAFMRERVHRHGSRYPTGELMERATGATFSTDALIERLARLATAG